jgi:hypothetical protein
VIAVRSGSPGERRERMNSSKHAESSSAIRERESFFARRVARLLYSAETCCDVFATRFPSPRRINAAEPYHHGPAHALPRFRRSRAESHDGEILRPAGICGFDPERGDRRRSDGGGLSRHARHLVSRARRGLENYHRGRPRRRWSDFSATLACGSDFRSRLSWRRVARGAQRDCGGGPCESDPAGESLCDAARPRARTKENAWLSV